MHISTRKNYVAIWKIPLGMCTNSTMKQNSSSILFVHGSQTEVHKMSTIMNFHKPLKEFVVVHVYSRKACES